MKKLKLGKLLLGSLSEAQQRNVLGGDDGSGYSSFTVNNVCTNPAPPPKVVSIDSPCSVGAGCAPPPPKKTVNAAPCA